MASNPDQTQVPAPEAAPATEEAGFAAAFAERSAGRAGRTDETQTDGEQPSKQEPAPAGSEQAPSQEATDSTGSGTRAEAFDPFAGMTPEQKSHWERLQASERSQRGRVGALTKKLNTYSTATPAPAAAPQRQEAGEQTSTNKGEEAEVSDLDKRLQAVTDEYGDVVGPIAEVLKEVRAEITSLKGVASKAEVEANAAELTQAYAALEAAHPDYSAIAADANFGSWLGDQPPKVQELANSYDPREVSLALTLFKTERSAATASQSGGSSDQGSQDSTATDDRRRRQLEGSRQVPGKGQPTAAGVPDDFGSAFKARAAARAAAR